MRYPTLTLKLVSYILARIVAASVSNNTGGNPPFCSLGSLLIVSLIAFIRNPDSLSDLIIFMMPSNSSFEIINAVAPDPKIFFRKLHLLLMVLLLILVESKHFKLMV